MNHIMTVEDLMKTQQWQPIRNCPGRYRLISDHPYRSVQDLVGPSVRVYLYQVATAKDDVFVAPLDAGGVISYRRADGRFIHTLNTAEGFARKLSQLGIDLPQGEDWFQGEDVE